MFKRMAPACLLVGMLSMALAQQPPTSGSPGELKQRTDANSGHGEYRLEPGTHILLNMINSVSTKTALVGDRIYLETAFPVLANGRIVVPQGSWVTGTITEVRRPGRAKGRGSLQVQFDSLVLPNGTARNFKADVGALDARNTESLKREENKIEGPGDKKTDAGTIIGATEAGGTIGTVAGLASKNAGAGAGIGLAGGLAAGVIGVLLTRGPDATLPKGSTVEMVLDRPVQFDEADLNFSNAAPSRALSQGNPPAAANRGFKPQLPF